MKNSLVFFQGKVLLAKGCDQRRSLSASSVWLARVHPPPIISVHAHIRVCLFINLHMLPRFVSATQIFPLNPLCNNPIKGTASVDRSLLICDQISSRDVCQHEAAALIDWL